MKNIIGVVIVINVKNAATVINIPILSKGKFTLERAMKA
jgi:hypothetical protein